MANTVVSALPALSTGEAELNALQLGTRGATGMRALQLFMEDYAADSEPPWRGPIPVWARHQVAAFADAPAAAATGGPNVTVVSDSNAAIGAASNPPNAKARHQSLCTHFVRDALAFRFINLKHVATDRQFADVFTKAPTASMLMLLKTLMDGTATVPLLARLISDGHYHFIIFFLFSISASTRTSSSQVDSPSTPHSHNAFKAQHM